MPDVTIEVEVYCATCGDGLCNLTESTYTRVRGVRGVPCFRVEACPKCIDRAREEGIEEGREQAEQEAEERG